LGYPLVTAVTLTAPQSARANPGVLYAAPVAVGSGNCSSWDNACTLQTALANAISGDEIWVKMGVHYPGAAGQREATFTLKNSVALYGGFAGTETSRDQRDWQANLTVLSGDIDQNDLTDPYGVVTDTANIRGENAYHVVTGGGTDSTAVLDGFFITAGQANDPTLTDVTFSGNSAYGGGMYNSGGSPTLTEVTFSGNSAYDGGGMYNSGGSPTLTEVTFSGNSAYDGGGMYNDSSSPTLTEVTFSGNSANYGGGVYNLYLYSSPTLTEVTFSGNSANYGGGMYNDSSSPTLVNIIFHSNSATDGGGVYNYRGSPTLANVTFNSNSATNQGGGMVNVQSNPTLANLILWGNSAPTGPEIYNASSNPTISYSDIQGCGGSGSGWQSACGSDGGGNIDTDPRFVDAASGNLRLQLTSPAIDAGNNAAVPPGVTTDLDGNSRFVDIPTVPDTGSGTPPIVDMGAYEVPLNRAPAFTSTPVTTATQGVLYTYAITTTDPDLPYGDALTVTAPVKPAWLTLTDHGNGTATLSGTPSSAHVGDHAVVLRAIDRAGAFAEQSFTITVAEKPRYSIFLPLVLRNTP